MRLSLFLILICLSGIARGTNYYVDPSSTASTQNGTLAAPWKTLAQVQSNMNSFAPGDFIYFKRGQTFSGTLDIKKSGTTPAPITFTSYGVATDAMPVFTGVGAVMILVSYVHDVIIDGIMITDPTMNPADHNIPANLRLGFYIDGSSYISIKNCDISLVGGGINIQGDNNTIDKTTIQNLRMINNTPGGDDDYGAIPIIISGSNNTITNNFIKDGWANSYDYMYDGGAIEVYGAANNNNKIMYNTAINCDGFMEIGYSNGGTTNDNLVAYNKILNCGELVYISTSGNFATTVHNLQFYNNAIVNTVSQLTMPNTMIGMSSTTSATNIVILKNNIFWLTTGIDVALSGRFTATQLIHEDNIYHLGTGSVLNYTSNTSELTTLAPIFTSTASSDPLQWNYLPVNGSPAIDFGQNLGLQKDFVGNPVPAIPNAGILESSSTGSALTVTSSAGIISCNGGNTTVTVSATGGTAPYTGTGNFTVVAGSYTYTVTDAAGTVRTTSLSITQPSILVSTVTAGTISIFGNTTTVTATATGGSSPYTYNIDAGNFQSGSNFPGIGAGSHTIIVKDAKGCTSVKTITITQPSQLQATATAGTINCNGGTTTLSVTASGGTSPYTGTGTFTVGAGTYNYTITDAAGAVKQVPVIVTQPSMITATINAPGVYNSSATTTATITATGGSPAYTYSRDNGSYQSSNIFNNVAIGNHTIKVKDSKGCIYTFSFSVALLSITPLEIAYTKGFINCFGGTTTVTISATGGIPPYNGTGTYTVYAGTVTYTVTDAGGNVATKAITAVQPDQLVATVTTGTIIRYGDTTSAVIGITGGIRPYTYKLNSGVYQASNEFHGLGAGTYTVTIKDVRNCTTVISFTLTQPAQGPFKLTLVSKTNETCRLRKDGTIRVTGSAGTLPYTYKLGNGGYGSAGLFTNLSPGTYTITGKDATNATASVTVTINASQVTCTGGRNVSTEATVEKDRSVPGMELNAYPNPSNTQFSLLINNDVEEDIHITVMDINGKKVYETTSRNHKTTIFGEAFTTGVYFARVVQGRRSQVIKLIKIK